MRINLRIYNEKQVIVGINSYKLEKIEAVKKVVNRTAGRVERGAKKRAPVDEGRLRSSIHMRPFRGGLEIDVGTNVEYGVYQEFGTGIYAVKGNGRKTPWAYVDPKTKKLVWTRGNRPHPFLFPAFEEVKPDFVPELKKALKG
jgi:HK97 gp10 family phage protein